jgi:hypothetical protein
MYSGFVMMGYFWAQQAAKAKTSWPAAKAKSPKEFYTAKIQTAEFYFERCCPGPMATTVRHWLPPAR